jgi:2-phosphoglycerate kinase
MTLDFQIEDKTELKSWVSKEGFAKNITQIVTEFNLYRGIKANKIFISGMPLAGKSYTATVLAKNYSLPHILIK